MMSLVALCLVVCGQQTSSSLGSPAAPSVAAEAKRPFHEIQKELSALFKQEALSKDEAERATIVRRLCELHSEIRLDPRHEYAEAMKGYRAQVWARLKRIQADLKSHVARLRKVKAADVGTDPELLAAMDSMAASLNLVDNTLGGPTSLLSRGGGARPGDYGPELVDLIERTINPDFWDVNGGPGTIVYYQPLMCLVVTATGEIHGDVGGILGGLRRAGGP